MADRGQRAYYPAMITAYFQRFSLRAPAVLVCALLAFAGLARAATPAPIKLTAEVGPGFTITLKKGNNRVAKLKPGRYAITVRDRAANHNFHLVGPGGVNRSTSVVKVVTAVWTVTLKAGTYTYLCDPHASRMRASFLVAK